MILQLYCTHLNLVCHSRSNFPAEKAEPLLADLLPKVIKLDLLATEQSLRLLSKAVRRCMCIHNSDQVLKMVKERHRERQMVSLIDALLVA